MDDTKLILFKQKEILTEMGINEMAKTLSSLPIEKLIDADEQMKLFPATRYMGSKSKLLEHIWSASAQFSFDSVIVLFFRYLKSFCNLRLIVRSKYPPLCHPELVSGSVLRLRSANALLVAVPVVENL